MSVRTHVTFTGGERYIGPDESLEETVTCGRGILEKVAERLENDGLPIGDVIVEDWGAVAEVNGPKTRLHVCAGFRGDDWLIFVCTDRGPDVPTPDSELLRRVVASIDAGLKALPGIDRVAWHREEDFAAGREETGASGPVG